MPMIEVLRSSVNTWECDQMGHMNVRHYFGRADAGLAMLGLQLGLPPRALRDTGLMLRAQDQHVRFNREMRPGTPYSVSAGVLDATAQGLRVYEEIRILGKSEVAAAITTQLTLVDAAEQTQRSFGPPVLERAHALRVELPEQGAPRGILRDTPRTPPMRTEAIERGLTGAYLGPLLLEDCDARGQMTEAAFMARISDGIAHFFRAIREGLRPDGVGGAALEYRFVFHERPLLGDLIEVRTGLKGLGRKTLHLCHWVFDVESGRCVATSEAVAVSFDLTTRKSVEIPDDIRVGLGKHVITGLSV
ncbi:MAG TPA: thioesterase family protein [Polyangiales bacterium]